MAYISHPVNNSSNIEKIGYTEETETLTVSFINGKSYHYTPVTPDKWVEAERVVKSGESIGQWFIREIRNDKALQVTKG